METDTKDPDAVVNDFQSRIGILPIEQPPPGNPKCFEYRLDSCKREIKVDTVKNYVCLSTYCNDLTINFTDERTKALYYVAYINEEFSVTGLDTDPDNGKFKLKSSQSFPSGMNFEPILDYFWKRHNLEFPLLVKNIERFNSQIMADQSFDPRDLAREFHKELKNA